MIVRLVKLTILPAEVERFRAMFPTVRQRVLGAPGCIGLELLSAMDDHGVYFTQSEWTSVGSLEDYRNSALFADVWPLLKPMFAERAQAWTLTIPNRNDR